MELLINSVGFFFVVFGVVGFYSAVVILAWQRLAQIRRHIRDCRRSTGRLARFENSFDIEEGVR